MLCISGRHRNSLRLVIRRALNDNQILLLNFVNRNSFSSVSSLLRYASLERSVPLSTLRLNISILESLGLVRVVRSHAELTGFGELVLMILNER